MVALNNGCAGSSSQTESDNEIAGILRVERHDRHCNLSHMREDRRSEGACCGHSQTPSSA